MKSKTKASGFSLMEVLFSILVLSMGLIFVACQFPVGLRTSVDIAETTTKVIDTHNAGIMLELKLGALKSIAPTYIGPGVFIDTNPGVYFLYQPNKRIHKDYQDMVMDNPNPIPAIHCFERIPSKDYPYYPFAGPFAQNHLPQYITRDEINSPHVIEKRNLGALVSPPVDETDKEVLQKLRDKHVSLPGESGYNATTYEAALNTAVYDVALQRNYSWCTLYQHIGGNAFRFYIFTLRQSKTGEVYAMQKPPFAEPRALPATEDRLFPVPWYVRLLTRVDPTNTTYFPPGEPWDRFILDDYTQYADAVENILRQGSIIVDADYGHVYEILDISNVDAGWQIRLRTDLHETDHLRSFWVVPPAIVEHSGGSNLDIFADKSPVVEMAQCVISF